MRNYIGNNNEINKKKYKKSLPPKLNPDAGNVEHNIDMFNKASSGDANLSSAAGMNGMAESYDRDSLIARITEFGKHYNFDKYTDAQLNAMLNRLVDAENYRKRVLPKHQDRIGIQSDRHIMNDDPSYNFDDPEREGEYRVENLREALNRLDHYCIDNDKTFYDLRSLYENIQHQLTPQEKQELKKLVDTTNDPDAIKAYIDSKDPDRKNEDLNISSWIDAFELFNDIIDKYFPDDDKIEEEIKNLYLKHEGEPAFDIAYKKWQEGAPEDFEDDDYEDEDQLMEVDWNDETDANFDESLNEGALDTLKAKRQARLDKIDAKKRAEDPLYDAMRRYSLGEPSKKDDPKLHPELDPRNFIYDRKFQSQKDRFGNPRKVPDNVISVVIKSNVEAISTDAFKDHKNLKEVRFEGKTIMIYPRAFMNCTSLTYIELPESLHTIQSEAFKNCTSLRWIKFQANQLSLDNNAFEGCKSLNLKAILQKYSYEVDQERTKLFNSYKFNTIIYRKKKKSVDESMKDMDSLLLLQSLLNQYPDISIEDEDYLNSLSYSDLVKEIKNRGWEDVLNEDLSKDKFEDEILDIRDILAVAARSAGGDIDDTDGYIESSDYMMDRLTFSFNSTTDISNKNFIKKIKKSIEQALENQTRFKNDIDIFYVENRDIPVELKKKYKNYFIEIEAYADDNDPLSRADWSDETDVDFDESLNEDTVKQGSKWVNKGKEGTHGKFKTKKAADAQRKAMFANGYKGESLQEDISDDKYSEVQVGDTVSHVGYGEGIIKKFNYKSTPSQEDTIYVTFSQDHYGNKLDKKITRIFPFPRAFKLGWLRWLNHPDFIELNDSDIEYTDVDFDESLKLKESSPVNYKKKISLIRDIDRGIPYSMRYKEADIVTDYDNDELILYWVTEDPFTKDELQEFAFHATECCHDMYDDIVQIALTYRGISRGFNSDDNLNKLIWIDAAGEWRDEDWDHYVENLKKVGVDVQANDLIAADWEDSTDFDFDESLKLKKKRR